MDSSDPILIQPILVKCYGLQNKPEVMNLEKGPVRFDKALEGLVGMEGIQRQVDERVIRVYFIHI